MPDATTVTSSAKPKFFRWSMRCFGLGVRADDRAAFERVEDLGRVEAQHGQVAMAQQALTLIGRTPKAWAAS
jgi:hypothetical protein